MKKGNPEKARERGIMRMRRALSQKSGKVGPALVLLQVIPWAQRRKGSELLVFDRRP